MFADIIDLHEDCQESFIDFSQLAGHGEQNIACAGISTLRTQYAVGKSTDAELQANDLNKQTKVHYLIVTKSGQGKLFLPNAEHNIEPDTIMVLPAGSAFRYQLDGDEWSNCWILLRDTEQFSFIRQLKACVFASSDASLLYQSLQMLESQVQHKAINPTVNDASIEIRLVEILLLQIEQALHKEQHLNRQQVRFKQTMQAVYKQLNQSWSVAQLAEKMHLSEPQFYRLCQKETGLSPMKLLTKVRLEYACHLLQYTNYNLEQIATSIGYADGTTFAHRFKKQYQIAPGKWRLKAVS